MPKGRKKQRVCLLLSIDDGTLFQAVTVARNLRERGFLCLQGYLQIGQVTRDVAISDRQMEILGPNGFDLHVTHAQMGDAGFLEQFDMLFCASLPQSTTGIVARAYDNTTVKRRPVLVCSFRGLDFTPKQGILNRVGIDVTVFNSYRHARAAVELLPGLSKVSPKKVPYAHDTHFEHFPNSVVGNPVFWPRKGLEAKQSDSMDLVFLAQAIAPHKYHNRLKICRFLVDYAKRYPEAKVVCKLRHLLNENSAHVHQQIFPFELLLKKHFDSLPENLIFSAEPMEEALRSYDRFITVSSTAALEAATAGKQVALIGDFFADRWEFMAIPSRKLFQDSKALVSLDELLDGRFPTMDPAWLVEVTGEKEAPQRMVEVVERLLQEQEALGSYLPFEHSVLIRGKGLNSRPERFKRYLYESRFEPSPNMATGRYLLSKATLGVIDPL